MDVPNGHSVRHFGGERHRGKRSWKRYNAFSGPWQSRTSNSMLPCLHVGDRGKCLMIVRMIKKSGPKRASLLPPSLRNKIRVTVTIPGRMLTFFRVFLAPLERIICVTISRDDKLCPFWQARGPKSSPGPLFRFREQEMQPTNSGSRNLFAI